MTQALRCVTESVERCGKSVGALAPGPSSLPAVSLSFIMTLPYLEQLGGWWLFCPASGPQCGFSCMWWAGGAEERPVSSLPNFPP